MTSRPPEIIVSAPFERWAPRWVACLVFLTPLIFCLDMADTFDLPKMTGVYLSAIGLFALWVYQQTSRPSIRIQRSGLDCALGLFLFSAIVSTIFSMDPWGSFWGAYKIYVFGSVPLVAFGTLFWLTLQCRTEEGVQRVQSVAIGSAVLVSLYGWMQYAGWEIFQRMPSAVGERVWSSLGNPLYMGAVCMMALPLVLNRLRDPKGTLQWSMALAMVLLIPGLALSLSRSAWFGVAAGVTCLLFNPNRPGKEKKGIVYALLVCLGIMALIPGVRLRAAQLMATKESSNAARVAGWKAGLQVWRASPILGAGTDTFFQAFRPYRNVDFIRAAGPSVTQADAHNDFIQIAATQGTLGVVAYLLVLGLFFKNLKTLLADPARAGLAAALVALVVQNQFNFSAVTTTTWAAVFAALALPRKEPRELAHPAWRYGLRSVAVLLPICLWGVLIPLRADLFYKEGQGLSQTNHPLSAMYAFEKAVRLQNRVDVYQSDLVNTLRNVSMLSADRSNREAYLDRAWQISDQAPLARPHNPDLWNNRGVAAMWMVQMASRPLQREARESFEKAVALDSVFVDAWANLAKWEHLAGHLDQEKEIWRKVIALDPQHAMARQVLGLP